MYVFSRSNLCGLTYTLYTTLGRDSAVADSRQGLIDKFCAVVPATIVALAYVFDSEQNMESNVGNGVLNVVRHSCGWSGSGDVWLTCTLYEKAFSHNWDAYSFENGKEACSDVVLKKIILI